MREATIRGLLIIACVIVVAIMTFWSYSKPYKNISWIDKWDEQMK